MIMLFLTFKSYNEMWGPRDAKSGFKILHMEDCHNGENLNGFFFFLFTKNKSFEILWVKIK